MQFASNESADAFDEVLGLVAALFHLSEFEMCHDGECGIVHDMDDFLVIIIAQFVADDAVASEEITEGRDEWSFQVRHQVRIA